MSLTLNLVSKPPHIFLTSWPPHRLLKQGTVFSHNPIARLGHESGVLTPHCDLLSFSLFLRKPDTLC